MQITDTTIKNTLLQNAAKSNLNSNDTDSFLQILERNLKLKTSDDAQNSGIAHAYAKIEKQAKQDAQMFKQFDFMQLLNKLQFDNVTDKQRAEIFAKMTKIANEI